MNCDDPVPFLFQKHMYWARRETTKPARAIPFAKARKRPGGADLTLIAWGKWVKKALSAIQQIENAATHCSGSRVRCRIGRPRAARPPPQRPRAAAGARGYKYTKHHGANHGRRNSIGQGCDSSEETGRPY